jgi:hypothetical protein
MSWWRYHKCSIRSVANVTTTTQPTTQAACDDRSPTTGADHDGPPTTLARRRPSPRSRRCRRRHSADGRSITSHTYPQAGPVRCHDRVQRLAPPDAGQPAVPNYSIIDQSGNPSVMPIRTATTATRSTRSACRPAKALAPAQPSP